jgi:hypothetical protein
MSIQSLIVAGVEYMKKVGSLLQRNSMVSTLNTDNLFFLEYQPLLISMQWMAGPTFSGLQIFFITKLFNPIGLPTAPSPALPSQFRLTINFTRVVLLPWEKLISHLEDFRLVMPRLEGIFFKLVIHCITEYQFLTHQLQSRHHFICDSSAASLHHNKQLMCIIKSSFIPYLHDNCLFIHVFGWNTSKHAPLAIMALISSFDEYKCLPSPTPSTFPQAPS